MEPMKRARVLVAVIGLALLVSGLPAHAQVQDQEPSGMYDLDASCSLRAGIVRCVVQISDLGTGQPLFQTAITSQVGAETTWSASPEYKGVPYLFQVTVKVNEVESEIELEIHRNGEPAGRQRVRTVVVATE